MAQQFLLRGSSLEQLALEATELYGANARIVRAERVLDAGVAGFLGRRHLEVTVQVPDGAAGPAGSVSAPVHVLAGRTGIAALLESADTTEDDVNRTTGSRAETHRPSEPVSTESGSFAELLARLGGDVRPGLVPAPLSRPGELVLVMGLEETARDVTGSMARQAPSDVGAWALYSAGGVHLGGRPHMDGWWDAARARAHAVDEGSAILAACTPGAVHDGLPHLETAAVLGADQVWLVVDARHKPDDTSEWVDRVRARMAVDALAVIGAGETRSAATVNQLRIPIGWLDGLPAPRTVL
ncbi:MAG: hypothetical protein ACTHJJ_01080 [Intrasporangium sp.]|uniref:hypothetical protein n=1 Tax=Intrasporangium sp. TaxID=1925024 RepID=UPI003F82033D